MLSEIQKASLAITRARAKASLVDLVDRQQAEDVMAANEGLSPATIQPLTEVEADLVVSAIEAIPPGAKLTADTKYAISIQRVSCAKCAGRMVALRSDQLAAICDAALGEGNASQIHG